MRPICHVAMIVKMPGWPVNNSLLTGWDCGREGEAVQKRPMATGFVCGVPLEGLVPEDYILKAEQSWVWSKMPRLLLECPVRNVALYCAHKNTAA